MRAKDGKMRLTDCAIFRIIQSVPSPNAEHIIKGYEALIDNLKK